MSQQDSAAHLPKDDVQGIKPQLGIKFVVDILPAGRVQASYMTMKPQFLNL